MTTHALASRKGAALLGFSAVVATMLMFAGTASAATSTVPLGTSSQYAVVGASTVTNTGGSVLNGSLGLSPGTSVVGFPPGHVIAPGVINKTNAAAAKARADLTAAYLNALGRPLSATTGADLANRHLQAGVYAGPSKGALSLNGPLVLDGAGNANAVFIFQTNSSLTTGSSSTVTLVNGAQECNVFWQVGSSATLGTGSVFAGNILALTSISVTSGVTVHGRALARNGAVTLDNDLFTRPTCATGSPTTTPSSGTSTTAPAAPGSPTAVVPPGTGGSGSGGPGTGGGPGTPPVVGPPRTGASPYTSSTSSLPEALFLGLLVGAGAFTFAWRR